jgi:selenide,water dikinase
LGALPQTEDPRVLVDYRSGDDAGVFCVDERTALVQTVDFFTPVVDDPEAFGRIAAANALSDVYAMGGRPLTALSIAGLPDRDFPEEWAASIVRGGALVLREAGCALLGGHTIRDPEVKFGYAVTGLVDPQRMLTNAGGRPGQVLVLTKPLGSGVISTALKAGRAEASIVEQATRSMVELNAAAADAALKHGVTGATDVTGFGLLGHAVAVAHASRVTLEIVAGDVPLLPGALDLALRSQAGGLLANRAEFSPLVGVEGNPGEARLALLFDPQTSGGLLLLVPDSEATSVLAEIPGARAIGRVLPAGPKPLIVRG